MSEIVKFTSTAKPQVRFSADDLNVGDLFETTTHRHLVVWTGADYKYSDGGNDEVHKQFLTFVDGNDQASFQLHKRHTRLTGKVIGRLEPGQFPVKG